MPMAWTKCCRYLPWLQGPIYIVSPGQTPSWVRPGGRVVVVHQNDLIPPEDNASLPTFNTNVSLRIFEVCASHSMFARGFLMLARPSQEKIELACSARRSAMLGR